MIDNLYHLNAERTTTISNVGTLAIGKGPRLDGIGPRKSRQVTAALNKLAAAILVLAAIMILGRPASAQCPAVGQSSTCGVVITVTNTGATVSFTGQPPFDGIEDQLVGVINNSNRPIRSLELRSSVAIFSFDGDGIDTFGIPGNPFDNTGYGGPNAYFTNINPNLSAGTVNFIVPIAANGGTTFFSLEEAITAATACSSLINNALSGPNLSGGGILHGSTNIRATFTPNQSHTLSQAAQVCGFIDFNWVQTITRLPDPSPFHARNNGNPFRLTSASTPFNDPPAGGGYTYQGGPDNSFPFYYDRSSGELAGHQTANTLSFSDVPMDFCLVGPLGIPSLAWLLHPDVRAQCDNTTAPRGSSLAFTTHLAGVLSNSNAQDLGIGFTWTDSFNGTFGGIATTKNDLPPDPNSGEGGITILSVQTETDLGSIVVTNVNGAFDFCLQDETNPGNVVLVNTSTGAYSFCCGGVNIASGTGTINVRGTMGSLDNAVGVSRVHIQWDTSANSGKGAGTAIVQGPSAKIICQITDRNLSNNNCQCSSTSAPSNPVKVQVPPGH